MDKSKFTRDPHLDSEGFVIEHDQGERKRADRAALMPTTRRYVEENYPHLVMLLRR